MSKVKSYTMYHPSKGQGAAATIEVWKNGSIMMSFAKELPEGDKFDWKNKLNFKLGLSDIAEMILVLRGVNEGIGKKDEKGFFSGLFHKNEEGHASLSLSKNTKGSGYFLKLYKKANDASNVISINMYQGEAVIVEQFLLSEISNMCTREYTAVSDDTVTQQPKAAKKPVTERGATVPF